MCEMMKETSSHTPTKKSGKIGQKSGGGAELVCICERANSIVNPNSTGSFLCGCFLNSCANFSVCSIFASISFSKACSNSGMKHSGLTRAYPIILAFICCLAHCGQVGMHAGVVVWVWGVLIPDFSCADFQGTLEKYFWNSSCERFAPCSVNATDLALPTGSVIKPDS